MHDSKGALKGVKLFNDLAAWEVKLGVKLKVKLKMSVKPAPKIIIETEGFVLDKSDKCDPKADDGNA